MVGTLARLPFVDSTSSTHFQDNYDHIGSINTYEDERYCIDVSGADFMSYLTASHRITGALWVDSPGQDWDGLGDGLVYFKPTGPCITNPIDYNRINFYVIKDPLAWPANCGSDRGCNKYVGPLYDDGIDFHDVWTRAEEWIGTQTLWDFPYTAPNHEVGHALGFKDGGPGLSPPTACGPIMHLNGCNPANWPGFPTQAERDALEAHLPVGVPPGGGGGGGFGKGVPFG